MIDLKQLYNIQNKALVRVLRKDGSQTESLIAQLAKFQNSYNLSFQFNTASGYQIPTTSSPYPYLYLGLLPEIIADQRVKQGYNAQGKDFTFKNCDGNGNSYFAFFSEDDPYFHEEKSPSLFMKGWLNRAVPIMQNEHLPGEFFFPFELHMGGCGGYDNSYTYDVKGAALGLPFGERSYIYWICVNLYKMGGWGRVDGYGMAWMVSVRL